MPTKKIAWVGPLGRTRIVAHTPDVCVAVVEHARWMFRRVQKINERRSIYWFLFGRLHIGIRL